MVQRRSLESFCKRTDLGSLPDPDLAMRATSLLRVFTRSGPVYEIGKTPISQVQLVSGLPIYSTLKLWLNNNNKYTASVRKSVVD